MLVAIVITLIILLVIQWIQVKPFFWKNAGIPYSVPWPIFGSVGRALVKPYYEVFVELYRKMGDSPAYGFHLFGTPALIVSDPDMVKKITVTQADHFMSHGFYSNPDIDPLGKSIFFVNGEEWKSIRSKMTPYFTPSRIKGMIPIIQPTSERFVEHITKLGKLGPVDVQDASMRLAVDIVISTVYGLQPDSFDNPDSFFFKLQKEFVSFVLGLKFLLGDISPTLYVFAGLTVLSKSTTTKLRQLINDVIRQRLNNIGTRPDFMQGMVELMQKEELITDSKKKYNKDGTPVAKFDDLTVSGQCMLMYGAGTETTGATLSFLLYRLALHQDIQVKAREEIVDMITRTNGQYGLEELHELKYIHSIFYETMRMYPVFSTYARKCTKEINIDGIDIPVGTKIMISPFAMHHNPKYFPNPEQFIPERFQDDENIIPGSYVPYGMGPRTCIGIKFSEVEILLALCKLLPKVKLTVSSKTEIPLTLSRNVSLTSKYGTWLNVEELK